jgi:glycosyltransferase involved in cell wall biosynthesis
MARDSDKARLAFVLPFIPNSNIGGMESVAANLIHSMNPEQYDFSLVCFSGNNGIIPRIDRSRVSLKVFQKRLTLEPSFVLRLAAYFWFHRPTVVHTYNTGALVYAFPAAKLARVPGIVHVEHGRIREERPVLKKVRIAMTKRVDHVIAVSDSLRKILTEEEGVSVQNVSKIINGVDTTPFDRYMDRDHLRRELGLTPDDWAIGTVGSLSEWKNQQLLIRAAASVQKVKVFIAGMGPKEHDLRNLIGELGVADRVFLVGGKSDIPRFLAAMDLFSLPSTTEATSLALLEAMAARLPVLATAVGGNTDIVVDGKTGFLVASNDLDGFIKYLMWSERHRNECRVFGQSGRKRIEEKYNFTRTVKEYEQVFQKVVKSKTQ